jgi:phosphotransferase system enzyme I (PtsI)
MSENGGPSGENTESEIRLLGNAVSRGIAVGRAVCLHGRNVQFFRAHIGNDNVSREIGRLDKAFSKTSSQLATLAGSNSSNGTKREIFSAHKLILEDPAFRAKIEAEVVERKMNAEWAISVVADSYISRFKAIPDEHLRERYIDVEDVAERLLSSFSKDVNAALTVPAESIVAAEELRPSTLAEYGNHTAFGCITEHGGWTSHTFILARELGIPSVTGLCNLLRILENGQMLIVDGFKGEVIVNPSVQTLESYKTKKGAPRSEIVTIPESQQPLRTLDGRNITLQVNAETAENVEKAKLIGAKGVGLYRSEHLFNLLNNFPTEEQQFEAYRNIANATGADGAKFRTFDLGIGQISHMVSTREKNPALGLRGIRLSLTESDQMRQQFRALLRAAAIGKVDVLLPMVNGVREIREAKAILLEEADRLRSRSVPIGEPKFGAMIEIPSAVLVVDQIVEEVDFLCLGTNDLVQYLLAVDRDNEAVADWFRTLHPAVIRSIAKVIMTGIHASKPVVVCGEMAGSPFYTPMLIGLGATEFSMNLHSLDRVMTVIRGIAFEEAAHLVKTVEKCHTAEEIETLIASTIQEKWLHLYPENFLEQRKI